MVFNLRYAGQNTNGLISLTLETGLLDLILVTQEQTLTFAEWGDAMLYNQVYTEIFLALSGVTRN